MINFELVGGVDFRKGCYPGQEIVARAQYRGAVKRRMHRVSIDSMQRPAIGSELFSGSDGAAVGTLVAVAQTPSKNFEALAVVQLGSFDAGKSVHLIGPDGPALTLLDLPYSIPAPKAD
jgi:folate-binding Fe-S cluster repair protein YgfZ